MPVVSRKNLRWALSIAILFSASLSVISRGNSPAQARVWVLEEGEIVEYNPSDWAIANTVKVPKEFIKDPDRLQITRTGEMLFYLDPEVEFGDPRPHFGRDQIWLWNGRVATVLKRQSRKESGSGPVGESQFRLSLSADGRRLFWFENEFREHRNGEEMSVLTHARAWQTDLTGAHPEPIANFSFPQCKCETGACSETCPEASFWFPSAGVGDFFLVNHWIPGQLSATFQATWLFQKSGSRWAAKELPGLFEEVLDAAQGGGIVVHAIQDGACCGWDNEGNDQALVSMGERSIWIFDERQKYGNPNYDVSFYTGNAGLSPDASKVAVTIISTANPGAEIRLSDGGEENPRELTRVRAALQTLPVTEVILLASPEKPLVELSHAAFAGWLSDREILLAEKGVLTAFDIVTRTRRISRIKIPGISTIFVR